MVTTSRSINVATACMSASKSRSESSSGPGQPSFFQSRWISWGSSLAASTFWKPSVKLRATSCHTHTEPSSWSLVVEVSHQEAAQESRYGAQGLPAVVDASHVRGCLQVHNYTLLQPGIRMQLRTLCKHVRFDRLTSCLTRIDFKTRAHLGTIGFAGCLPDFRGRCASHQGPCTEVAPCMSNACAIVQACVICT